MGIAGMPGSGKGVFRRFFMRMGYPVVTMGDQVRAEVQRRNLEPTPENVGKVMLNLRELEGPAVVAKRCVPEINRLENETVGVDGIRSLVEVEEFKKHFPNFVLVAIHASPKTRYERLSRRNRSDDPQDWETFMERDLRELGVGVGAVISTADYMLINERSIGWFKDEIRQLLRRLSRKYE
ncbi:MAG: AAA family ATPase [Candidatus Bathyarchaeota archaeon]|nr:AAA family ATPase [Candidatus Bathyarchaeota archaeon]